MNMGNNRGFTLIEVLASIVILSIIITGLFQYFIFSQKTTTSSQEKLVAINIAQSVMEQIKEDANSSEKPEIAPYWEVTHPSPGVSYPKTYSPIKVEGENYTVTVSVGVKLENGLQMVSVAVQDDFSKIKSSVKGLVKLCT